MLFFYSFSSFTKDNSLIRHYNYELISFLLQINPFVKTEHKE